MAFINVAIECNMGGRVLCILVIIEYSLEEGDFVFQSIANFRFNFRDNISYIFLLGKRGN